MSNLIKRTVLSVFAASASFLASCTQSFMQRADYIAQQNQQRLQNGVNNAQNWWYGNRGGYYQQQTQYQQPQQYQRQVYVVHPTADELKSTKANARASSVTNNVEASAYAGSISHKLARREISMSTAIIMGQYLADVLTAGYKVGLVHPDFVERANFSAGAIEDKRPGITLESSREQGIRNFALLSNELFASLEKGPGSEYKYKKLTEAYQRALVVPAAAAKPQEKPAIADAPVKRGNTYLLPKPIKRYTEGGVPPAALNLERVPASASNWQQRVTTSGGLGTPSRYNLK